VTVFVFPLAGFLDGGWTLVLRAHAAEDSSLVMGSVGGDSSIRVGFGRRDWLERSSYQAVRHGLLFQLYRGR
jgi:hypothetical protein